MSDENWKRLGQLLIERRVKLGYPKRAAFARDKGQKSDRILAAIENGERRNFDRSTLALIEDLYEWQHGSIDAVLDGRAPLPTEGFDISQAEPGADGQGAESMFQRFSREADEAQAEFERLVGEMVTAEAKVDAATRRVYRFLVKEQKINEEIAKRAQELGRPLTQKEWLTIDSVARPTAEEVAFEIAIHAANDPHEWTRYEMALIERADPDYPNEPTAYSRFVDMTTARAQVARLGPLPGEEPDEIDERIEKLKSDHTLAAKRGAKEPDDQ